jgi:hypothetical protein
MMDFWFVNTTEDFGRPWLTNIGSCFQTESECDPAEAGVENEPGDETTAKERASAKVQELEQRMARLAKEKEPENQKIYQAEPTSSPQRRGGNLKNRALPDVPVSV